MKRTGGHRACAKTLELAILIALPILSHYLIPITVIIPKPYTYLGIGAMLLGLSLMSWTSKLFREKKTGFQLHNGATTFVTSGPFRFSRNPMYLGMLIWLLGLAALLGSLTAFLFPALFFVLANVLIIPPEEKLLAQRFEAQYDAYKRHVRRWL